MSFKSSNRERILNFSESLSVWFETVNYKGTDPYMLDASVSKKFSWLPFYRQLRMLAKPLHPYLPQKMFEGKNVEFALVYSFSAAANRYLYKFTENSIYATRSVSLLDRLRGTSVGGIDYAWGLPFEWGGEVTYNRETIYSINQTLFSLYLIDAFRDDKSLIEEIIHKALHVVTEITGYEEIDENTVATYYSNHDKIKPYNGSAMAAESFLRYDQMMNSSDHEEFAKKLINYVIKGQNEDGSWYYGTGGDETYTTIDNRHTCYILNALIRLNKLVDVAGLDIALEKGTEYYETHMLNDFLPKWEKDIAFPVDMGDISMATLYFLESEQYERAEKLLLFAIDEMSNGVDEFYYKYFKNGRVNKTVFIRWSQAWMFKALTTFLDRTS